MVHLHHKSPDTTVKYEPTSSPRAHHPSTLRHAYQVFRAFCRSVGVGILVKLNEGEEPKVLISSSRLDAIARCGVHILPACVSIVLITLNLCGFFLGPDMPGAEGHDYAKLALLQIVAKAQELLVVGSVGAIIVHVVRSQLLYGNGLPLGFLTSGFSFPELSFFWSTEFLGAIQSNYTTWARKYLFVVLLLLSCLIALMAGPATAILTIPRMLDWEVGGGIYWLNGTSQQLWPTSLTSNALDNIDCNTDEARLNSIACPSSGIPSLYEHYRNFQLFWRPSTEVVFELSDSHARKMFHVKMRAAGDGTANAASWTYTTHLATARMQDAMKTLYNAALDTLAVSNPIARPGPMWLNYAKDRSFHVSTKIPAVRTVCSQTPSLITNNDTIELSFPIVSEFSNDEAEALFDVTDAILNRLKIVKNTKGFDPSRIPVVTPVTLPESFESTSMGLVILTASDDANDQWVSTACSVDARWTNGKSTIKDDWFSGVNYDFDIDKGSSLLDSRLRIESWQVTGFEVPDDGNWHRIHIDPTWYNLLSPSLTESTSILGMGDSYVENQTMLEKLIALINPSYSSALFEDTAYIETQSLIESLVSTLFADGLSRSGSQYMSSAVGMFNQSIDPAVEPTPEVSRTMIRLNDPTESFAPPDHPDITKRTMHAYIRGYVMTPNSWFDYFCVAILLLHIALAVGHSIWIIYFRYTSEAWDTITDMIVLAQTSSPPDKELFADTCAGARSTETMGRIGYIEVSDQANTTSLNGSSGGSEQLRLRFARSTRSREDYSGTPKPDMLYGQAQSGDESGNELEYKTSVVEFGRQAA